MEHYLDVATIVSTSHLDGRIVLAPKDDLPLLVVEGMQLHLVPPGIDEPRSVIVEEVEEKRDGGAIARFNDVCSIDAAKCLVGKHCLTNLADLPKDVSEGRSAGGFDIVGWRVEDETSGLSGEVSDVWNSAGQMLCSVILDGEDPSGEGHIIPLADDLIIEVNKSTTLLSLRLPKGIFEL